MKTIYKLTALIAVSALMISGVIYTHSKGVTKLIATTPGEGMDNDAQDRLQWELRRLAAPDGKIPDNMRAKELAFAATLPSDVRIGNTRTSFTGWINRGPWNVGGRTRSFGIDKLNENNLLAGTPSGDIWRSTDGGVSWNTVSSAAIYHGISCIMQDQRTGHESTWYAGSGEGYGQSASGGAAYYLGNGMLKSVDNGVTWTSIASTSLAVPSAFTSNWQIMWNVAQDKHNKTQNVIYAALYGQVLKSVNGGTSWTGMKSGNSYFTDVAVTDSGSVYVTMDSTSALTVRGIWRSPDGSLPMTNITPPTFPKGYNRIVMGINPMNQNEIYFLANSPNHGKRTVNFLGQPEWSSLWKYTYLSGNGSGAGGRWQDLTANLPDNGTYFDTWCVQGSYDMVIRVKPTDSNTVFIGGTNLYRSTSAFSDSLHTTKIGGYTIGATLPVVNSYADHHPDQHVIAFLPSNPKVLFSCNDGGIFKTMDNTAASMTWTTLNHGYVTSMFYTVAMDHATSGSNILIGGAQDNGSWYTNTSSPYTPWLHDCGGDGAYCAIADSQKAYYFSIQNGKTVRSQLDANGAVTSFRRIDPIGGKGYQFVNPFVIDPNQNSIMYLAGGKNMWRNDNLDGIPLTNAWDSITTNWVKFPDTVATTNSTITAVAISKTPANRLYYGTDVKRVYRIDNANTGVPGPPTDITYAGFPASGFVSCISIDPNNADRVMVIFSNYGVYSIFMTTDGGTTWAKEGGNLEQDTLGGGNGPSVRWASMIPVSDGYVYMVSTSVGLYATDSLNGVNTVWVQQGAAWPPSGSAPIGNSVCDMTDYRQSDGMVAVATHSSGIYSAKITSVQDITTVKNNYFMSFGLKAYPNPFTSQCTVDYTLSQNSKVRIMLYNETGQEVRSLAQAEQNAGEHTLTFNRESLAQGVYYVGLQVGNTNETKKLMIIR